MNFDHVSPQLSWKMYPGWMWRRGCSSCIRALQIAAFKTRHSANPSQNTQPQALRFITNSAICKHHSHWGTETKPAPTKHTSQMPEVLTCGKGGGSFGRHEVEGRSWAETGVTLKTTPGHVQEFKATGRYTYNIKYKSTTGHTGLEQTSCPTPQAGFPPPSPADQMVELWEGKKHICNSAPTFSINVLDPLIRPTNWHSSKSRCPELSLPTSGWCMWIICAFSEINTQRYQSKQTNIVVLSEATQTCKFLLKTHRNQRLYSRD